MEHLSMKQLIERHPEDEKYIQVNSSKYYWPERERAKIQFDLQIISEIQGELLTTLASRKKISRNIAIDDRIERIIERVLDLIDLKIDSMAGDVMVSEELRKVKLPSMLMALEKLLAGRNTHYRNLLRQLGLPETLHDNDKEKLVVQVGNVVDKPSDEELRKSIDDKLSNGSQKIERREHYDEE